MSVEDPSRRRWSLTRTKGAAVELTFHGELLLQLEVNVPVSWASKQET